MQQFAPIMTIYKGYRFRSRLEARWAVFFDRCNETWIYEHDGYQLPSGAFLPDFYFPKREAFVEVKPLSALPIRHFEFRASKVSEWSPPQRRPIDDCNYPREIVQACEMASLLKLKPWAFVVVYGDPVDVLQFEDGGSICLDKHGLLSGIGFLDYFQADLWKASDVARAARFEHGEHG